MQYGDHTPDDVRRKLSAVGQLELAQMRLLIELEAGTGEIERRQIAEYLEMLPDAEPLVQLGIVISLGRTDEDGFKSTYFNQGDNVAEVIEGLSAVIQKLYPAAAPGIRAGTQENWEMTLELAICRKAALGIMNVCELADLDQPGAAQGEISTRIMPTIQSVYDMVKNTVGPDDSSDCEVYGSLEAVVGWVGGKP